MLARFNLPIRDQLGILRWASRCTRISRSPQSSPCPTTRSGSALPSLASRKHSRALSLSQRSTFSFDSFLSLSLASSGNTVSDGRVMAGQSKRYHKSGERTKNFWRTYCSDVLLHHLKQLETNINVLFKLQSFADMSHCSKW